MDTTDIKNLSPEAQRLIELTGGPSLGENKEKGNVGDIIRDNPELVVGLDEYIRWREENCAAVAKSESVKAPGHSLRGAALAASKEKPKTDK